MSFNIRIPNITASSTQEQIRQVHSYLFQVVEQLNWALNTIESTSASANTNTTTSADSKSQTSQEEDSLNTFNSIKGLIIKSADIVNAYYDEITTLINKNGLYEAYSDFGSFVEKTNNTLYGDSNGLTQQISSIQSIFDEDGNIKAECLVNGNIYSGILKYAYDGEAIVGIRVGQTTTKIDETGKEVEDFFAYAEFTANRLSFYDSNGYETAYISDKKLFINNVEIRYLFKMGGFEDTVQADRSIVTKWVG